MPLRDSRDALTVNWYEIDIINAKGEITYRNRLVTDLSVGPDNVAELADCGRARWKIENETFYVLKKRATTSSTASVTESNISLLSWQASTCWSFAIHTVCDIGEELWRNARAKLGPRYNFFSTLAAVTRYLIWEDLLLTLAVAKPPPIPP